MQHNPALTKKLSHCMENAKMPVLILIGDNWNHIDAR